MVAVVVGPETPPVGLNSFVSPDLLGKGIFTRIQNFRWDTGALTTRAGTALYLAAPVAGAILVDMFAVSVNGTSYLLGFFLKSGETRMYYSTSGSAWLEATEVGGLSGGTTGNSRFATNTGIISVAVVKAPQSVVGGSIQSSRDVVVILNGTDYNRIWDPGRAEEGHHNVTGAANNGSGLIRLAFLSEHGRNTGDTVLVASVGGVPNASGTWTVTRIDATHIDLQGSTFAGTYTSGGTVTDNLRLTIHQPIIVPKDASLFTQKATFTRYWQVKSASGKTYYNSGGGVPNVNDGSGTDRFDFSDSSFDVYTGANACIAWQWDSTVVAGQIATVYVPNSAAGTNVALDLGKGLIIGTEDGIADFGADNMLTQVKIEVNTNNAVYNNGTTVMSWVTLFDPSSSDDKLRRYDVIDLVNDVDADLPRKQWFFPADHLTAAQRLIFHIRVTRLANAQNPATKATVIILYICGAGAFPGTSEFTLSYEDEFARSESRSFVASNMEGAPLRQVGGPDTYSSTQAVFLIPQSTGTFYDYDLVIRNSDASDTGIEGGLNGEPSRFNIYVRCPTDTGLEEQALYMFSVNMWGAGTFAGAPFTGLGWIKTYTGTQTIHYNTSAFTYTNVLDWTFRQIDRPPPSDFQIAIPPAKRSISKNGRLIVGNVNDPNGTNLPGDIYGSNWSMPFRMEALATSATSSFRTIVNGESIQGFVSSAAGSQGVSHIHVITDKWLYPLGGSGSNGGNPLDATLLGTLLPAVGRGTNSPRSICEKDGAIFYLDHTGQYVKMLDGMAEISRLKVDDKPAQIPNGRMDDVPSAVFGSRMYSAYTLTGGSTNTRVLGWHDLMIAWEFDDLPPVDVERMCVYFDQSAAGSGLKLLFGTQAGALYQYETGTVDLPSNPIAIRLTTAQLQAPDGPEGQPFSLRINDIRIDADAQARTLSLARILTSPAGTYTTTVDLTNGWVTDENDVHTATVPVAASGDELSRLVQLDVTGNMTSGTKIKKITADVFVDSAEAAWSGV